MKKNVNNPKWVAAKGKSSYATNSDVHIIPATTSCWEQRVNFKKCLLRCMYIHRS